MTAPADPPLLPADGSEFDSASGGVKGAMISGTAWTATSFVSQQIMQLGISVILARLLLPREFGLIAMLIVFTGFARLLVESGFGAAVIQRQDLSAAHVSTAFWTNVAIGFAIWGLAAATAPLIAGFYGQPQLQELMPVAGADFVLASLRVVPLALLERRLMYRRIAVIDNISMALAGAAALACAFAGLGVWSLLVLILVSDGVDSLLLWALAGWRPSRLFERSALRDLWSYGSNLLGSNTLNYWTRNADNLLIGRFVGPAALGLYNRAYNFGLVQVLNVSYIVNRPLFPALSKFQDDPDRVRRAYLRAVGVVALVTLPIAAGLFVAARPFVLTLFGVRWVGSVPLFQILAFAAAAQAISTTTGVIYQSQGRTDWAFRWNVVTSVAAVASFVVGVHWGAEGVALAVSIRSLVFFYPSFLIVGKLIRMPFLDVVNALWRVLAAAVVSAAAAWAAGRSLAAEPPAIQLLVEVAVAAAVYLAAVHLARLEPYRDLCDIVMRRHSAGSVAQARAQEA